MFLCLSFGPFDISIFLCLSFGPFDISISSIFWIFLSHRCGFRRGTAEKGGNIGWKGETDQTPGETPSFFTLEGEALSPLRKYFHFHRVEINFLRRYYGPPEPLMKKERKPVPVVEEAPYEGPTIFDKVTSGKECINVFSPSLKTNPHHEPFQVFKTKKRDRSSMEGKEGEGEGDWKRLKVGPSSVN